MTLADAPARAGPATPGIPPRCPCGGCCGWSCAATRCPGCFPLLAALFVFDPYRTAMSYPPLWDLRASVVVNKLLPDFVAFVAGVAAWMGSRDSRRHTADLVTATRPAPLGGLAGDLGGHRHLGGHPLPVRRRGDLRRHRHAGDLGARRCGGRWPSAAPNWR